MGSLKIYFEREGRGEAAPDETDGNGRSRRAMQTYADYGRVVQVSVLSARITKLPTRPLNRANPIERLTDRPTDPLTD